jgi:amino acid transporter
MIRRYPSSGSAYTYAQKSIHPNVGFMVGWSSWLDYLLSPWSISFWRYLSGALFPNVNHWVWVIGLTAFMTVSTYVALVLLQTLIVDCFIQLMSFLYFTYLVYNKLTNGVYADGPINAENRIWSLHRSGMS